jgi:hypothetical protein
MANFLPSRDMSRTDHVGYNYWLFEPGLVGSGRDRMRSVGARLGLSTAR